MNTKNTWVWLVAAAILFASIFIFDRYLRPAPVATRNILPGLLPAGVTSVQVIPTAAPEIRADRTGGDWFLSKPIAYPAQAAAIETLLGELQKLTAATRITADEHHAADSEFGFDPPQTSLVIEGAGQGRRLLVGNKTPPGDQVYLRVVGVDGVFVADAGWLKAIPRSATDWRDTALVDARQAACDWIVLTNGTKGAASAPVVIELRRNPTNHLWRMTRPLAARANAARITDALQQLSSMHATRFVTDDPNADLSAYGLQPADLDVWLGRGTDATAAIHAGKSPTNDLTQVYARREGWNAIITTGKEPLAPWHGTVNDFRDPYLLELAAPVAEIEVRGPGDQNDFTLHRQGSNDWRIAGESFPADADSVRQFIKMLAGLRVTEFVKAAVTAPDLPAYGLTNPPLQVILRSTAGDSNAVIAQLDFGANQDGKVFVRRADEDFIYAVAAADAGQLPRVGWEFRDRRIWNFAEADVAQITLRQNGKTRQLLHNGTNQWSFAPGSQGSLNGPALEETAHRLGELVAYGWVARNPAAPETLGFKPDNLQVTVELKNGGKLAVDFGMEVPEAHTAVASVTLEGVRWAFVFPPVPYQFVLQYLTIPANVP